jgi:hypothetical protein
MARGGNLPALRGDIEKCAGLTNQEHADPKGEIHPKFIPWRPYNGPRTVTDHELERDQGLARTDDTSEEMAIEIGAAAGKNQRRGGRADSFRG